MPSNQSRFDSGFQNSCLLKKIFILLVILFVRSPYGRLGRRLAHTSIQIPFHLSFALQVAGALPVLLSILPLKILSIPTAIGGSISLAIIATTFPAAVIRPTRALFRLISSRTDPLNLRGLRIVTRSALGLSLPILTIALLFVTDIITLLVMLNLAVVLVLVVVIILAQTTPRQVRFALLPGILLLTVTILIVELIETSLPIIATAVILYLLTFLVTAIFAWSTTALIALAPQITRPPAHLSRTEG